MALAENILNRETPVFNQYFDDTKKQKKNEHSEDTICLFLSFDICNSTEIKGNYLNWETIIKEFYHKEDVSYLRKWKNIGDEIVYVGEYSGLQQLIDIIESAYRTISSIESTLNSVAELDTKSGISKSNINVKATLWLAHLSESSQIGRKTIYMEDIDEFIGTHIDEGFRMATKTSGGKLLIDPKIVYIVLYFILFRLYHIGCPSRNSTNFTNRFIENHLNDLDEKILLDTKKEISKIAYDFFDKKSIYSPAEVSEKLNFLLKNMYFMNFIPLKGIWNGKPYPIFWYFDNPDTIKYYELESSGNYPVSIFKIIEQNNNPDGLQYSSRDLLKVFETVGVDNDVRLIIDRILSQKAIKNTSYIKNPISNFYYTVACVKDNKVLALRRKPERRHLGNVWEFFVSKHTNLGTIDDIKNNIKNSLGVDINLITDETEEENIFPLHFCTVYRSQKKHNSILCCAEFVEETPIEELQNKINEYINSKDSKSKYSEARFVGLDEINSENDSFISLNSDVISYDAEIADSEKSASFRAKENYSTMYFKESIQIAISFYHKYQKTLVANQKFNWWQLFE